MSQTERIWTARNNFHVLRVFVHKPDAARIKQLIGPDSYNGWLRGLINQELEDLGEPMLCEQRAPKRKPGPKQKAEPSVWI